MKWKDAVFGAMLTLIVTTIAGVIVYYWTKEPDIKKTEALFYSFGQSAKFKGGATNLGFNVISFGNAGGIPAKHVVLTVRYEFAKITDHSIESSSNIKPRSQKTEGQTIEFIFDEVVPSESITLSFITNVPDTPQISLRSSTSLGKQATPKDDLKSKETTMALISKLIPLLTALQIFLFSYLLVIVKKNKTRGKIAYTFSSFDSKNNVAFSLIHQGLIDEAFTILNNAIKNGEDGAYVLSNLALCLAIQGEEEKSNAFINAAEFYTVDGNAHEGAVIKFNKALISLHNNNFDLFLNELETAHSSSPNHVKRYCEYSIFLTKFKNDPRYLQVLSN